MSEELVLAMGLDRENMAELTSGGVLEIDLRPLGVDARALLVQGQTLDVVRTRIAAYLQQRSGGVAFTVTEYASWMNPRKKP